MKRSLLLLSIAAAASGVCFGADGGKVPAAAAVPVAEVSCCASFLSCLGRTGAALAPAATVMLHVGGMVVENMLLQLVSQQLGGLPMGTLSMIGAAIHGNQASADQLAQALTAPLAERLGIRPGQPVNPEVYQLLQTIITATPTRGPEGVQYGVRTVEQLVEAGDARETRVCTTGAVDRAR